jgi:hypothetical protein
VREGIWGQKVETTVKADQNQETLEAQGWELVQDPNTFLDKCVSLLLQYLL